MNEKIELDFDAYRNKKARRGTNKDQGNLNEVALDEEPRWRETSDGELVPDNFIDRGFTQPFYANDVQKIEIHEVCKTTSRIGVMKGSHKSFTYCHVCCEKTS